jgi:pyruvate/2-oxoglutarate dehydrogenase complex dihydrolipoamide dehydrogenase (E3) component
MKTYDIVIIGGGPALRQPYQQEKMESRIS